MSRFIDSQRAHYGIPCATTCRALEVSQSWFYKWRHGDASPRHARRAALTAEIGRLFAVYKGTYGSPRIRTDLREQGWQVSVNTVAKIMRELGPGRVPSATSGTPPGQAGAVGGHRI
jgi:putative transposase